MCLWWRRGVLPPGLYVIHMSRITLIVLLVATRNWLREGNLHPRSSLYESDEITTSLSRNSIVVWDSTPILVIMQSGSHLPQWSPILALELLQIRSPIEPLQAGPIPMFPATSVHICVHPQRRQTGLGSRIRTCGPLLPKQVLYQTKLHPEYTYKRSEHGYNSLG